MADLDNLVIPKHIAIILDGNGRWADKKGLPKAAGHKAGSETVKRICEDAYKIGVEYLTIYAFSTENWSRSKEEVDLLMSLLRNYLKDCVKTANKNKMRVRIIGDKTRLDEDIVNSINELEEATKNNTGLKLQIAINYGGRDEIRRTVKEIAEMVQKGEIQPSEIDERVIADHLDTRGIPDPDLLIRTSGEQRLSNFLLWQLSYTEFCFQSVLWPDYTRNDLIEAVKYYNSRDRRFGGRKS